MGRAWLACLVFFSVIVAAGTAMAFPFPISDVRGLGMGGAYVAEGAGIAAVKTNPAGLVRGHAFELAVPVSARAQDHIDVKGLLEDVDDLMGGQSLSAWFTDPGTTQADRDRMVDLLASLDKPGKNSIDLTGNAMAGFSFNAFGLALGVGYADEVVGSMAMRIDDAHLVTDPLDPAFATSALPLNTSEIDLYGIDARQMVFTAAKQFGGLSLGANLRQIAGNGYYAGLLLFDNADVDVTDLLDQTSADISGTAVDVGAQFDILPFLRGGIVACNVNGPSFDLPAGGGELTLDPRYRAGVALTLPLLVVTADMDLTTTENLSGGEFREMAMGAELNIPVLKVRAGMSKNTAMDGAPTVLHAGLGLDFAVFKLDVGGAFDPDQREVAGGASLSFTF